MPRQTLGKLPSESIRLLELPRLAPEILEGYRALVDLTGTISDACDQLGIVAVIPAQVLPPVNTGKRVVGPALTVRNIARDVQIHKAAQDGVNTQGETEAHNLAQPGDVLVVQGVAGVSSMGGVSASIGKRQGEIAAVVDGAVRDIDHSRSIGYPIWSAGVSPITGKWRIETVAINGPVQIASIEVKPGDLVVADECGVCFVPFARAAEVLAIAQRLAASEKARLEKLDAGIALAEYLKLPR